MVWGQQINVWLFGLGSKCVPLSSPCPGPSATRGTRLAHVAPVLCSVPSPLPRNFIN